MGHDKPTKLRQIQTDLIVFGSGQRSGAVVSAVAVGVSVNSSFSVWLLVQPGPVLRVQPGPVLLLQKPCDPQRMRGTNRNWTDGRYILKKNLLKDQNIPQDKPCGTTRL